MGESVCSVGLKLNEKVHELSYELDGVVVNDSQILAADIRKRIERGEAYPIIETNVRIEPKLKSNFIIGLYLHNTKDDVSPSDVGKMFEVTELKHLMLRCTGYDRRVDGGIEYVQSCDGCPYQTMS